MIHREFNEKRTALANEFAAAGADLLAYMGSSSALAAIPNTDPPKYVAAGPLKEIAKLLPAFSQSADVERLLGAHAGVVEAEPDEPSTIALGQGLIEIGQGHHGNDRAPALLFGRNGAGKVGVETQGDRVMEPGECIAAVTFENYQSLDVVVEKLGELRARIWPDAPHSQLSYGAAPHFRGYAHLGIGAYVIDHSAAGEPPELAISIATEAQKAGRVVGDTRDNEPGALVQPKDIAVRLRFENVAGLDALERQLRFVRSEHFADAAPAAQAPVQNAEEVRSQWISVEDGPEPEEGQRCIILIWPYNNRENEQIECIADYVNGAFVNHEGDDMHPPSHWMPFPNVARPAAPIQQQSAQGENGGEA